MLQEKLITEKMVVADRINDVLDFWSPIFSLPISRRCSKKLTVV